MSNNELKNKIQKLTACLAATVMSVTAVSLAACDGNAEPERRSELIGSFENNDSIDVALTADAANIGGKDESNRPYVYTTDMYPLYTVSGESVRYTSYQKLRLKRDYTYEYTLEIMLRKVTSDANTDLVKLTASTVGTFDYTADAGEYYTVTLSDPTGGAEYRYGASIAGENNIYGWKMSATANYGLDLGKTDEFDKYVEGRSVSVARLGSERVLSNDVFYADIMNDLAPYCTFVPNGEPETPDEPEPVPEIESVAKALPAKAYGEVSAAIDVDGNIQIFAPSEATGATLGDVSLDRFTETDGRRVFVFDADCADYATVKHVRVGDSEFDFDVKEYLTGLSAYPDDIGDRAAARFAISLLNAAKENGANIDLSADMLSRVYNSKNENHYNGAAWSLRDNLTYAGGAENGFSWNGVPALTVENGKAILTYSVRSERESVTAKATVGGREIPVAAKKADGGFTVAVEIGKIAEFTENIELSLYDGDKCISGVVGYSVMRAVARTDHFGADETQKPKANALYSLAKSAAWLNYSDTAVYSYYPSERYAFKIGEFDYGESASSVDFGDTWGVKLYVDGVKLSDRKEEHVRDGLKATRKNNGGIYDIELDGATVDGIYTEDNSQSVVTVSVMSDSVVTSVIRDGGSIYVTGDLLITGEIGAKLTVKGNVFATGKITVENVTLAVDNFTSDENGSGALTGGSIEIKSGAKVECKYIGASSGAYGISSSGNIVIAGDVAATGFDTGIYLSDGKSAEQTLEVSGGQVNISAQKYGIACNTFTTADKKFSTRDISFTGGVTRITVGENGMGGIGNCCVTVGDAQLFVTAKSGSAMHAKAEYREWDNWTTYTSAVTLTTTSGSERIGKVSLVNESDAYTACLAALALDGGDVYIAGRRGGGVLVTDAANAVFALENCNLTVENFARGHGIEATKGGEQINISVSAKLTAIDCNATVATWGTPNVPTVNNNGLVILNGYGLDFTGWEFPMWSMQLVMNNKGQIRQYNHF